MLEWDIPDDPENAYFIASKCGSYTVSKAKSGEQTWYTAWYLKGGFPSEALCHVNNFKEAATKCREHDNTKPKPKETSQGQV